MFISLDPPDLWAEITTKSDALIITVHYFQVISFYNMGSEFSPTVLVF